MILKLTFKNVSEFKKLLSDLKMPVAVYPIGTTI